jgi:hypothetical protein
MFNWPEIEEWARLRSEHLALQLSPAEVARLEVIQEYERSRKTLRGRFAAALVRFGARLDPDIVVLETPEAGEAVLEGRLAAYLP